MIEELLPCPFCKGKAVRDYESYIPDAVRCEWKCTVSMLPGAWNTRHPKVSVEEIFEILTQDYFKYLSSKDAKFLSEAIVNFLEGKK